MLTLITKSTPSPIIIPISKTDRQTLKILKQMFISSQKQSSALSASTGISTPLNVTVPKLFSPLIYPQISTLCSNKQCSLHTLCCALQIYQNYKQKITTTQSHNEIEELDIAAVCLSISENVNETLYLGRTVHILETKDRQMEKLKLQVLQMLKWKVNYVTFASICQMFMNWIIPKIKQKMKWFEFDISICRSHIYSTIEQFNFLIQKPQQCVESTVLNIFQGTGLIMKESLRSIVFQQTNQISIILIDDGKIEMLKPVLQSESKSKSTKSNSNCFQFLPGSASKPKMEQIGNNAMNLFGKEFNFQQLTHNYTNSSKPLKIFFQPIPLFLLKDENQKQNTQKVSITLK